MLSAYPTKHARIGNAVGLDTPASAVALLRAMRDAGLRPRRRSPASTRGDGDALIHALIAAGGQDPDWLTEEQLAGNPVRIAGRATTARWFATLPADLRDARRASTGARRPASCSSTAAAIPDGEIVSPRCRPATWC